jgi:crossover junction endodeoxyribonuclease RusA
VKIRLPLPPSINRYYVQRRNLTCKQCGGRVLVPPNYLSREAREYRKQTHRVLMPHLIQERFCQSELAMLVDWHPIRDIGDVDNRAKPLLDALEHAGLFENDRQIKDLRLRWGHAVSGGAADIQLWEI